jgi:putative redox protein
MAVIGTKRVHNYTFEVNSAGHSIPVDVTTALGGDNSAPDPHDYMQIALAGCTAITLQMYAQRKEIPLESSDIKIQITQEGSENKILRQIKLLGPALTEDQRLDLLRVANKCPIHLFLERGAQIESKLVT